MMGGPGLCLRDRAGRVDGAAAGSSRPVAGCCPGRRRERAAAPQGEGEEQTGVFHIVTYGLGLRQGPAAACRRQKPLSWIAAEGERPVPVLL